MRRIVISMLLVGFVLLTTAFSGESIAHAAGSGKIEQQKYGKLFGKLDVTRGLFLDGDHSLTGSISDPFQDADCIEGWCVLVTVTNNGHKLFDKQVGGAAYKAFEIDVVDDQELFDHELKQGLDKGETWTEKISVPCGLSQVDLFKGELIEDFSTGERYGDRKIGDARWFFIDCPVIVPEYSAHASVDCPQAVAGVQTNVPGTFEWVIKLDSVVVTEGSEHIDGDKEIREEWNLQDFGPFELFAYGKFTPDDLRLETDEATAPETKTCGEPPEEVPAVLDAGGVANCKNWSGFVQSDENQPALYEFWVRVTDRSTENGSQTFVFSQAGNLEPGQRLPFDGVLNLTKDNQLVEIYFKVVSQDGTVKENTVRFELNCKEPGEPCIGNGFRAGLFNDLNANGLHDSGEPLLGGGVEINGTVNHYAVAFVLQTGFVSSFYPTSQSDGLTGWFTTNGAFTVTGAQVYIPQPWLNYHVTTQFDPVHVPADCVWETQWIGVHFVEEMVEAPPVVGPPEPAHAAAGSCIDQEVIYGSRVQMATPDEAVYKLFAQTPPGERLYYLGAYPQRPTTFEEYVQEFEPARAHIIRYELEMASDLVVQETNIITSHTGLVYDELAQRFNTDQTVVDGHCLIAWASAQDPLKTSPELWVGHFDGSEAKRVMIDGEPVYCVDQEGSQLGIICVNEDGHQILVSPHGYWKESLQTAEAEHIECSQPSAGPDNQRTVLCLNEDGEVLSYYIKVIETTSGGYGYEVIRLVNWGIQCEQVNWVADGTGLYCVQNNRAYVLDFHTLEARPVLFGFGYAAIVPNPNNPLRPYDEYILEKRVEVDGVEVLPSSNLAYLNTAENMQPIEIAGQEDPALNRALVQSPYIDATARTIYFASWLAAQTQTNSNPEWYSPEEVQPNMSSFWQLVERLEEGETLAFTGLEIEATEETSYHSTILAN